MVYKKSPLNALYTIYGMLFPPRHKLEYITIVFYVLLIHISDDIEHKHAIVFMLESGRTMSQHRKRTVTGYSVFSLAIGTLSCFTQ